MHAHGARARGSWWPRDKSLADVVAHEIAHSWTGNLVTNATWTHFWLNEGWTRWFELSIMARIQGDDR